MTTPAPSTLREYDVSARSDSVFGRVVCTARNHHFIVDGPVQNGCPGEAITPIEVLLTAVASCGVELMHVIAREQNIPLTRVAVKIYGAVDRSKQSRTDVTTFNTVKLDCTLWGPDNAGASALVEGFTRRCPIFGTVKVATADVQVRHSLGT